MTSYIDCLLECSDMQDTQKEMLINFIARLSEYMPWYEDDDFEVEEHAPEHTETCEGCRHLGKWENEVEYGYPSPCTRCKRRVDDNYER